MAHILNEGFRMDSRACILGALMLLMLPLKWLLAALFAALIHELGHIAAVLAVGGTVLRLELGTGGARLETQPMGRYQELICAAAGPAASLLLLCFSRFIPRAAVCGAVQGIYNLIPVYPLDGGRILRCLTASMEHPQRVCAVVEWSFLTIGYLALVIFTVILRLGAVPVLAAGLLLVLRIRRKIPCKVAKHRVQ